MDNLLMILAIFFSVIGLGAMGGVWRIQFGKFKIGIYNHFDGKIKKVIYMGFISVWVYK